MGISQRIIDFGIQKLRSYLVRENGWGKFLSRQSVIGVNSQSTIDVERALTFAAVFACNRVATETIATLPSHIIEKSIGSRNIAHDHPLAKLLTIAPNPQMTTDEFWECVNPHIELRGNAFIEIARNTRGKPVALWPLWPDYMTVKSKYNEPVYEYRVPCEPLTIIPNRNMLHIKFMPMGGLVGLSPIAFCATTILTAIHGQNYGKKIFESGGLERIALVSERPVKMGSETEIDMLKYWEQTYGSKNDSNYGKVAMVSGVKPEKIGISPEDAQLLKLLNASAVEIASIFRIPLHKIQRLDDTIKANIEQQSIDFVQDSVLPRVVRIEKAINRAVLDNSESFFFKFNLDGLLRGDMKSRMEANSMAIQNGIKSPNEARQDENLNPYDGGEIFTRPLNMGGVNNQEKAEPQTDKKRSSISYPAGEGRRGEIREQPIHRSKVRKQWRPVLTSAYTRILKKEKTAILKAVDKYLLTRSMDDFWEWLDTTFKTQDAQWAKDLADSVAGMERAMADAAALEVDGVLDEDFNTWLDGFMDGFQDRHAGKTAAEIQAMEQATIEDTIKQIESRMDVWVDRAENEANQRLTKSDGAVALAVWQANGVTKMVWGGGTCPFCTQLNGQVVGITSSFIESGGSISGEGSKVLSFSSAVRTPPLHNGCGCFISPA